MQLTSLILISCFIFSPLTALSDWKKDVKTHICNGNFTSASLIIKQLPTSTKVSKEFEIDSLNTIMKRISNDFKVPHEDGIKALKGKCPAATLAQINN